MNLPGAQNVGSGLRVGAFLVALCLPLCGRVFSLDSGSELGENRATAPAPGWPTTGQELRDLPPKVDAFWNDAFGFRRQLIRGHALFKLKVGVSSSDRVVVGKEGWLFYTGESSIPVFLGQAPFSPGELNFIQAELEARRDWLASKGAKYLLMVGPNKESIYPEMMPDELPAGATNRMSQLVDHLKAHSTFEILDVRTILRANKGVGQLYHKTDTHWTDRGLFFAYQEMAQQLTRWFPQLPTRQASDFELKAAPPFSGDLSAMLGMVGVVRDERFELNARSPFRAVEETPDNFRKGGPRVATYRGPPGLPRAVVFHDSFFLPPEQRDAPPEPHESPFRVQRLLAESFSHSYFAWRHDFAPDVIDAEHPDVVIQEMVERSLAFGLPGQAPRPSAPPQ